MAVILVRYESTINSFFDLLNGILEIFITQSIKILLTCEFVPFYQNVPVDNFTIML
jgi:hypothetical protein